MFEDVTSAAGFFWTAGIEAKPTGTRILIPFGVFFLSDTIMNTQSSSRMVQFETRGSVNYVVSYVTYFRNFSV